MLIGCVKVRKIKNKHRTMKLNQLSLSTLSVINFPKKCRFPFLTKFQKIQFPKKSNTALKSVNIRKCFNLKLFLNFDCCLSDGKIGTGVQDGPAAFMFSKLAAQH
jgi:hypothetical protein